MAHPYYQTKIIGRIEIPDAPKEHKCICDDCGEVLDDSCGDPRIQVVTYESWDAKEPSSIKWVCNSCSCIDDLFGNHEPRSIFE